MPQKRVRREAIACIKVQKYVFDKKAGKYVASPSAKVHTFGIKGVSATKVFRGVKRSLWMLDEVNPSMIEG